MSGKSYRDRNLYKRGNVIWLKVRVNGKPIRQSLCTGDWAEARRRRDEALRQASRLRLFETERLTWQQAVVGYIEYAQSHDDQTGTAHVKASTLKRYKVSFRQLDPLFSPYYVDQLTKTKLLELAEKRRKARGITNATLRRDLTAASQVLEWVSHFKEGIIEANPLRNVDLKRIYRESRDPIVLPISGDIDTMVNRCPANFGRSVRLLQHTGMREEECFDLEWWQVDLARRTINLTKTKTNRPRIVPLNDEAVGTLLGTPLYEDKRRSYVFWHHDGKRYANVASRFAVLRNSAGVSFRAHDLRHWFAVEYLKRGGSIYDLQKILGHRHLSTTEIYLEHLTPDEQHRAKSAPSIYAALTGPSPSGSDGAQNVAHVEVVSGKKKRRSKSPKLEKDAAD